MSTQSTPWPPTGTPRVPLDYPSSTPQTPWYTQVPREHPEYPQYPPTTRRIRSRTSVGAHQDVVEVGSAIVAADDVDGAGDGVDHGRVPISRSPSRLAGAARPRHTCGQRTRTRPMAQAQPRTRGRPRRRPSYQYRRSPPCHPSAHTAAEAQTHLCTHEGTRKQHSTAGINPQRGIYPESRARTDSNGAHMQLGARAVPSSRVGVNVGGRDGGRVATADRMRARQHACILYIVRNQAMLCCSGTRNGRHGPTAYHISPYKCRSTHKVTLTRMH